MPEDQAKIKVLSFNMKNDEDLRILARKGYEVSKNLKTAGLKFKSLVPAASNDSIRSQFKLPNNTDLVCVELKLKDPKSEESEMLIQETKDQLLIMDNITLVDEKQYTYGINNIVYRLLLKISK